MEPTFWHERWQQAQIGFHLGHVNPTLLEHHAVLGSGPASRVFVPLCGKSLDLAWLAQQGHSVVGVELSPLAVQAFFADQGLAPQTEQHGPFVQHRAPDLEILCGDIFALTPELLGPVTAYFDRAALVAFPPAMRVRYVQQLTALLPPAARGLLVTFEYEPSDIAGPPFSVDEAQVRALYEPGFELSLLQRRDVLQEEPRFKERGMRSMHECSYALVRR
ncbi:MAG TPA: thiopurine S-methyltransferase [Polyangiales bacterium]